MSIRAAIVLFLSWQTAVAAEVDGRWILTITGHNTYLYGEPTLGGGLRMPWEVAIRFQVRDGIYLTGSGRAWLDGDAIAFAQPPGWAECRAVSGSYLDSSLNMHETPRIRFAVFPVAGEIDQGEVVLQPGYTPPGNYLAVTYECATDDLRAIEWFDRAERGKQVMGKRQDAEKRIDGERRYVRVREVIPLPPEVSLALPLIDGWHFALGAPDDARWTEYRLRRE